MSAAQLSVIFLCLLSSSLPAGSRDVQPACDATVNVSSSWYNRGAFERHNITNAAERGAVCNDWSTGLYYLSVTNESDKWLIFLESGSGCASEEDCNERYKEQHELMSSKNYTDTIIGKDIFDPRPIVNPDYWDFNFVLIPYCTSDLWVGNSPWTDNDREDAEMGVTVNNSFNPLKFAFRGLPLFQAVIEDLMQLGLSQAVEVGLYFVCSLVSVKDSQSPGTPVDMQSVTPLSV
jgi:hypothetical protein